MGRSERTKEEQLTIRIGTIWLGHTIAYLLASLFSLVAGAVCLLVNSPVIAAAFGGVTMVSGVTVALRGYEIFQFHRVTRE